MISFKRFKNIEEIHVVCIGTDTHVMDSFGPMVGSLIRYRYESMCLCGLEVGGIASEYKYNNSTFISFYDMFGDAFINIPVIVFGSLDEPIHNKNLKESLKSINYIKGNKKVLTIAVDVAITNNAREHLKVAMLNWGIEPGKGIGKENESIGDLSLVCCIYDKSFEEDKIRVPFSSAILGVDILTDFIEKLNNYISH